MNVPFSAANCLTHSPSTLNPVSCSQPKSLNITQSSAVAYHTSLLQTLHNFILRLAHTAGLTQFVLSTRYSTRLFQERLVSATHDISESIVTPCCDPIDVIASRSTSVPRRESINRVKKAKVEELDPTALAVVRQWMHLWMLLLTQVCSRCWRKLCYHRLKITVLSPFLSY